MCAPLCHALLIPYCCCWMSAVLCWSPVPSEGRKSNWNNLGKLIFFFFLQIGCCLCLIIGTSTHGQITTMDRVYLYRSVALTKKCNKRWRYVSIKNVALSKAYTFTFQCRQTSQKPQKIFYSVWFSPVTFLQIVMSTSFYLHNNKMAYDLNAQNEKIQ